MLRGLRIGGFSSTVACLRSAVPTSFEPLCPTAAYHCSAARAAPPKRPSLCKNLHYLPSTQNLNPTPPPPHINNRKKSSPLSPMNSAPAPTNQQWGRRGWKRHPRCTEEGIRLKACWKMYRALVFRIAEVLRLRMWNKGFNLSYPDQSAPNIYIYVYALTNACRILLIHSHQKR